MSNELKILTFGFIYNTCIVERRCRVKRDVGHMLSGSVSIADGYKLDKHISRVISEPADPRSGRRTLADVRSLTVAAVSLEPRAFCDLSGRICF